MQQHFRAEQRKKRREERLRFRKEQLRKKRQTKKPNNPEITFQQGIDKLLILSMVLNFEPPFSAFRSFYRNIRKRKNRKFAYFS